MKTIHYQNNSNFWNSVLRSVVGIALVCGVLLGAASRSIAAEAARVLIVVGPSNHAPGSHEVGAGARLIEHCLESTENRDPFSADVVYTWPEDDSSLAGYSTVVMIGDQFPGERLPDSDRIMKDLTKMMKRGCGIVCIHYGVGLGTQDVATDGDHLLLHWIGGYFATRCDHHQSVARIYPAAKIEPADESHPISRGWKPFVLRDEPYINNYFGPENNQLLPGAFAVATSMLPPKIPKREVIAWGIERPDSGRGFGVTLPHFYRNWELEPLRRLILNGIVWTAKEEIPDEGITTSLPSLETFEPESVDFKPRSKQ